MKTVKTIIFGLLMETLYLLTFGQSGKLITDIITLWIVYIVSVMLYYEVTKK